MSLHFKGIIAMQNTWTEDGRRVVKITHRELPLPVMHDSRIVGKVEHIEYDGDKVRGWGVIDDPDVVDEPLKFEASMDQMTEPFATDKGLTMAEGRLMAVVVGDRPAWPACVAEEMRSR